MRRKMVINQKCAVANREEFNKHIVVAMLSFLLSHENLTKDEYERCLQAMRRHVK